MILKQEQQNKIYQNTIFSRNKVRVEKRNRHQRKKNIKEVLCKQINQDNAPSIAVEILDIFHQILPQQHLLKKINEHSKNQHKTYVMSHRSFNFNLEKKPKETKYEQ